MNLETTHSFDIAIASLVGANKAIILKEVMGWCEQNRRNKRNLHQGEYWTYNTAEAYSAKFPYMKAKSIGRWMNELVTAGWLFKGQFAKAGYDRTLSHRVNRVKYLKALKTFISQNEECISQNEETITSLSLNPAKEVDSKKEVVAPNPVDVVQLFGAKISKLPKSTSVREWAEWETAAFIEYWESKNWKDKGKSIMPNLSRRIATWVRRGAEKAKYTKPAPNAEGYGEYANRPAIQDEAPTVQLSDQWEASYQRFAKATGEAMADRAKLVKPLTRSEYVAWSTHTRRPLTGRLHKNNLHGKLLNWLKTNTGKMSTYKLQREIITMDALLFHTYTEILKESGRYGEFSESVAA